MEKDFFWRRDLKSALLLGAVSLAASFILFATLWAPWSVYDEGFTALNGLRVLNGDIPGRDFWAMYPPGQSYVLAVFFKAFGAKLIVARLVGILALSASMLALAFIVQSLAGWPEAILVGLAGLILFVTTGLASSVPMGLALVFASILAAQRGLSTGLARWHVSAGILAGLACLFRLDMGVLFIAALALSLFCAGGIKGRRALAWAGVGALGVLLLAYGSWALHAGFTALWEQMVDFPFHHFKAFRGKPCPPLVPLADPRWAEGKHYDALRQWASFYLSPALELGILAWLGLGLWRGRMKAGGRAFAIMACALFGFGLLARASSRFDDGHMAPMLLMAMVGLAIMHGLARAAFPKSARVWVALAALGLGAFCIQPLGKRVWDDARHYPPWQRGSELAAARGIAPDSGDQEAAAHYIQAHTLPGTPVFVGNLRHDRIFINDCMFNFIAERSCPTAYSELHPGVATTWPVQEQIIRDLKERDVRWVVLWDAPLPDEGNESARSSGVSALDEYLRSKYARVAAFGRYLVLAAPAGLAL